MQNKINSPATLGILGGGQLGLMLGLVAKQFGYMVIVFEPEQNCPANRVADVHIAANYADKDALINFANQCDVITTEFENVPADVVELLSTITPVYPEASALRIAQNRIKEKTFFNQIGLQTAQFHAIHSTSDLAMVNQSIFPAILKTATLGYDGKGQVKVRNLTELHEAYAKLDQVECILEKMVDLAQEVSIIVARNQTGVMVYPLFENLHRNGILDITFFPADTTAKLCQKAHDAAIKIANELNYTGLLTIEFFITADKQLLINEIAPRPHNSGHITIEASITSQFEQQLRAVCGLQLADTSVIKPAAMLNLLGDVWLNNQQANDVLLNLNPSAKYHSYGKLEAKVARKMGHINLLGNNRNELLDMIQQLKQQLKIAD